MRGQPGFFDVEDRLARLSDLGDQLEAFARVVDFDLFRPELEAALDYSDRAEGGRPPFDPVLMFKILVIQAHNNLSDDRTEFLINDRLSFMRFLGLGLEGKAPDAKTIWIFSERLTKAGAIEALFDQAVRAAGYIPMSGQIVDASLVAAPKQRNSDGEKVDIKEGRVPEAWQGQPAKLRQKDRDARWTLVFGKARERADGTRHADIAIPVFGYKNHISIRTVGIECGRSTPACRAERRRIGSRLPPRPRQWRVTGSCEAKPQGGDRWSARTEAHGETINTILARQADITLRELKAELGQHGRSVSIAALWRFFRRHGITHKKRPATPPSRSARTS